MARAVSAYEWVILARFNKRFPIINPDQWRAWTNWTGGDSIFNKILIKKSSENGLIQNSQTFNYQASWGRKSRTENGGHIEYTQGAIHKRRPHQRGGGGGGEGRASAKSRHLRTWGPGGVGGGSDENADVRKPYDLSEF